MTSLEPGSIDPKSIGKLELNEIKGLGLVTQEVLNVAGINSPSEFMQTSLQNLYEIGLSRNHAKKLKEAICKQFPIEFQNFEEEKCLEDIEGIGQATAKSLRDKGMSYQLLSSTPISELVDIYGISSQAAESYQKYILENDQGWFTTAYEILEIQKKLDSFTFGAECLDQLMEVEQLNNLGINCGYTYEFFGGFRTGKSQICHQLCVTVQLPIELGGIGKKAIYIDTEGTFSPTRIINMVRRIQREKGWDTTIEEVLKNIIYIKTNNSDTQRASVFHLLDFLGKHPNEFGLLVVDSVTANFRAEYIGRGTLAERQQILNGHLNILHRIADSFNLAIVVTNQIQSNPAQIFGDPTNAVGGNIMGHWAGTRCYLRKSKGEKRIIKIYDSSVLGEKEAVFAITQEGILSIE